MSTDPLALEIQSLKTALEKYQHASHKSSLQLQRAHLESSEASARSKSLEAENARLKREIAVLRANPDNTPVSLQASELSLALRQCSDKLDLTEGILLQRTTELAHALSQNARMQLQTKSLLAELDRSLQREEEGRSCARDLERKFKAAQEEARMADVVVMEYADFVRTLETKRSKAAPIANGGPEPHSTDSKDSFMSPSSSLPTNGDTGSHHQTRSDNLVQSLSENRSSLQRLLHEFNSETTNLQTEITRLHTELSSTQAALDIERENSRLDRVKLAEALVEVDRHMTEDGAAGKIVSRYMRFSQSSIDLLQTALSTLKARHAATLATMSSSSEALSQSLALEQRRAYQLRDALDQLAEDISRETFGRRREIALRLHGVVREERTVEALRVWLRRAEEGLNKIVRPAPNMDDSSKIMERITEDLEAVLNHMTEDARGLLASLALENELVHNVQDNGSLGRVVLAEELARSLAADLQMETEKRMALTRQMAKESFTMPPLSEAVTHYASNPHVPSPGVTLEPSPTKGIRFPAAEHDTSSEIQAPKFYETARDAITHLLPSEQLGEAATVVSPTSVEEKHPTSNAPFQIPPRPQESIERRHPLLDELTCYSHRYDELQRAFRDCHLTLVKLKADIAPIAIHTGAPVVHNVIHRLDDFCEDARVELEIRIADEVRIAQGFEALLGVPGALADDKEKQRAEHQLKEFLDGTTPSVAKVYEACTSKLDNLQHDIARVKRALHESIQAASEVQTQPVPDTPPGWSSWTPPFLTGSPSRSSSPAPTFGTVITSPRARRVPSTSLFSFAPNRASSESMLNVGDPYAHLGLRIPMPSQVLPGTPLQSPSTRLRKTSSSPGMYLLGLGSGSGFFSKQEVITERETSQPQTLRGSEDDSDTQKIQSEADGVE